MTLFTYKGTTADGKSVTEMVDANDRFAVYEIARQNGHTVSSVSEKKQFSLSRLFNMEKINAALSRVKLDELVIATRNLASMLKAGLALARALTVIERQSRNPRMKQVMQALRESVNKGDPLNEALAKHPKTFSRLYVSMVRAGEESGKLAEALETISLQLERSSNLRKRIKGAMIYPSIVVTVMIIIGILMMIYVMPTITDTFLRLGTELPTTTKLLIGTSQFLSAHGLLAVASVIGFVAVLVTLGRTKRGRSTIHWTLIHLPVIGTMVKQTNSAYTARTLSSLLSAGVDVIGALSITDEVLQNVHFKKVIKDAGTKVEKGEPLSEAFIQNEKLYPVLFGEMILVGEETGQISQMLTEIAGFYENEVEQKTKDLSTIIEPLLMVVIGATVGFFALAMIAPIYSISDSI